MFRETCVRCRRPSDSCLCPQAAPMDTRTRIVLLMHPMEWRRTKCATGRLTCLNLSNSEIIPGLEFDGNPRVRALIDNPANYCVLLYPGENAINLSEGTFPTDLLGNRVLVVFLVDATWACSRKVLALSPGLLTLPRVMFTPSSPSRYYIKRQPHAWCLSTLEATHQLLLSLEAVGLDSYQDKTRLPAVFEAMQEYQVKRMTADRRPRHFNSCAPGKPGAQSSDR